MRRGLAIACALLLAVPAIAVLWLFHTEAGLHFVIGQLGRLRSVELKLEGVSGTLAGPLHVTRFELDHRRVHVIVNDVNADFRISGLLLLTVNARSLTGRDVFVHVRRVDTPDSGQPPHFLPSFLRIVARNVAFTNVRYVNLNGLTIDATRLAAEDARLNRTRLTVERFDVRAPLFDARGNYEMHAEKPLRLGGDARGVLRSPKGVPLELTATVSGTLDELVMQAQLRSPDVANVHAVLTRPNDSWRIAGRIASPSLGLDSVMAKPPFRLDDVSLRFAIDPRQLHADGALTIPGVGPLLADATGQLAAKRLTISRALVRPQRGNAQVLASGSVQFGGESPLIDARAQWTQLQYPLSGKPIARSASGQLRFSGAMPYTFRIAGALGVENMPPATLQANGTLTKTDLQLAAYAVRTLNGSLTGTGALSFDEPRPWSLTAQADNLDPAALHAQLPGQVSFDAQASGRGLHSQAHFDVRIQNLRGRLRGEPVTGEGRIERVADGVRLYGLDARWAGTHLAANGVVGNRLDVQWSLQSPALERLLPSFAGRIRSTGQATGPLATPRVTGTLAATNLQYQTWRIGSLDVDADVDAGSERASRLTVRAREAGGKQPWLRSVSIDASGNHGAHDIAIALQGMASEQATLTLHGQYAQSLWQAELRTATAGDGHRELQLQGPAQATLSADRAALTPLCFSMGTGHICAQGTWQRGGAWSAQTDIEALPLAMLFGRLPDDQSLSGTVSGRARGGTDGTLPWRGEADLHVDDAVLRYRVSKDTEEAVQLGSGALAAAVALDTITFNIDLRALENTFVRASAELTRTTEPLTAMPLRGTIKARTADANVLPLLVSDIDRADGVLEADIALAGTLATPQIDGRISLSNGELDSYRINLALRELQASAQLHDTQLVFESTARAGEGRLEANGRFAWENREPHGSLRLRGQNLLVADLPEYRVVASPDLRFQLEGRTMAVTGDVLIPSARIQPADLSGAVRVSEDARLMDQEAVKPGDRLKISTTIRTVIGDDVRLDTFGLQGRLQGEVTSVVRTGEDPIGRGELSVKEGKYEAYGQKLEITRGRLLMDNSPLDDPALDIQAERKLEEMKLGLNVRGTLRAPRLSFFSEPSMTQTQIVEYLLVGKPLDDYQNVDAQNSGSAGSTLALQGGGLLASQLGRKIGLEEVGVESDSTLGTALVLGKFLSPRLFVSYGISLTEAINTLKLRYTISDHWLLRTESGEAHAADLEYTIER